MGLRGRDQAGKFTAKTDFIKRHGYAAFRAFLVSVVCVAVIYVLERLTPFNVDLQGYLAVSLAGNVGSLIGQYQNHPKTAYRYLQQAFKKQV